MVLALTQIAAIQRCDAAPFYLFEDIHAVLDAQCRMAVGSILLCPTQTQAHLLTFPRIVV